MPNLVQLTFRGLNGSPAIDEYVRERAAKLDTFFDHITGCRVALEAPDHHHHKQGRPYRVRIGLAVPGAELVVGRAPDESSAHGDLYAAIDEAFDDAVRVLRDHVQRRRGYTKAHEHHQRGRVSKLFTYEGYGFIQTPEGDEVYFQRSSVLHGGFGRMQIGSAVRFVEEVGERGPQASTVTVRH